MNNDQVLKLVQQALSECVFDPVRPSVVVKGSSPASGVEIPMAFAERFAQLVLENRVSVDPTLGSEITIHRLIPGLAPKTFLPRYDITATWDVELIHESISPDDLHKTVGQAWLNAMKIYKSKEQT